MEKCNCKEKETCLSYDYQCQENCEDFINCNNYGNKIDIETMRKDKNKWYKINDKGIDFISKYKAAELAQVEWNKKLKDINAKMILEVEYETGMKIFFLTRIVTLMYNKFNYNSIEYIYGEQIGLYINKISEYIEVKE